MLHERERYKSKTRPNNEDSYVLNGYMGNPTMTRTNLTALQPVPYYLEYIKDIQGYIGTYFKPVTHAKVVVVAGTPELAYKDVVGFPPMDPPDPCAIWHGNYLPSGFQQGSLPILLQGQTDLGSCDGFLSPADAQQHYQKVVQNVFALMPEKVSLVNFLLELSDAEGLLRNVNLFSLSNAYLNFNFGWIPLIQDLKAFINLSRDVQRRLDALRKINNRWVTMSTTGFYSGVAGYSGTPVQVFPASEPQMDVRLVDRLVKVTTRCAMYYSLDLYGMDAALRACIGYLGLDNWAKIGWNAIPFSFVVDWLTGISNLLSSELYKDHLTFEGSLEVGGVATTFRVTDDWEGISNTKQGGIWPFNAPEYSAFSSAQVRTYSRRHGIPYADPVVDGLTPKQQLLAAALLDANFGSGARRKLSRFVKR